MQEFIIELHKVGLTAGLIGKAANLERNHHQLFSIKIMRLVLKNFTGLSMKHVSFTCMRKNFCLRHSY